MNREDQYILDVQKATRDVWNGINTLMMLQREWVFRDFTNNLEAQITLTTHPTVANLSAVVNTTANALNDLMAAGHGSNITKVL